MKMKNLTVNQQKRIDQLKSYLEEVKEVERNDFDKWFKGRKTFSVNVGVYLILIEEDG